MCKAICRSENVEQTVLCLLVKENPRVVVNAAAKVVSEESRELCKQNSNSLLQMKDQESLMSFTWDKFYKELEIRAPNLLRVVSSIVSDIPTVIGEKKYMNILHTVASGLHGRSMEMSGLHYSIAFVLVHGGCTLRDIDRLAKIGLCVFSSSVHKKLSSWKDSLDEAVIKLRTDWENGGRIKYQLVGDNWDKNILPSFRTSQQTTTSLHLFNTIAVVDRVVPVPYDVPNMDANSDIDADRFVPSVEEQKLLMDELVFIVASSVISNVPQMRDIFGKIYPKHLHHEFSDQAGEKTKQYPLGLTDCNENKTAEVIKMLGEFQHKYVPFKYDEIHEPVFFGGDRLTDERIQSAQQAMLNAESPAGRLEGFISKIEDFHRLMNFLEAIAKLTYSTDSASDPGTMFYFRNKLNARNVKGKVRDSYRAHKYLYYTVLDALCCVMFLDEFDVVNFDDVIPLHENFCDKSDDEKIAWINEICENILRKHFFNECDDLMETLREILNDPNHPENYWISNVNDGRVQCHFCERSYAYVGSLKVHEETKHNANVPPVVKPKTSRGSESDDVESYCNVLFKLTLLHKNLDSAVDMADGNRSVRSAKYELPVYNLTNKTKYAIGSIHLIALTEGILSADQRVRLTANRFINLHGGVNNNMALDEYVELLNRDSKIACSGFQTKDSILYHSKEFPMVVNFVKHHDSICDVTQRKGFHHLPSYLEDVKKIAVELAEMKAIKHVNGRKLKCKSLTSTGKDLFDKCFQHLGTLIFKHKPLYAYHRLGNKKM
ncbi:uncharacterized protein LOC134262037 [Saccostrea cucullata]|uniref:uncharacterized protein LOC134262037 n=1 Tax=Saccostrea cuccullata TaxID=36930 RepID=UPI002ED30189